METFKKAVNHPLGYFLNFPIHLILSTLINGLSFGIVSTLLYLNIKVCVGNVRQNIYGYDIHVLTLLNICFLTLQILSPSFALMVGLILILFFDMDNIYNEYD